MAADAIGLLKVTMPAGIRFSLTPPGGDRVHHVNEEDVRVVLSRLPAEVVRRLRSVHFNDQARGNQTLGYVTYARRDIALCALPPRISLTRFLVKGQTCEQFGAKKGRKWPLLAVRRFLLYDVFLHELGHLQIARERAKEIRRKFADEKLAEAFAMEWCERLWAERFEDPDPVHNPPSLDELASFQL